MSTDPEAGLKFHADSGMTYQQVCTFAFREFFIPILRGLMDELGPEQLLPVLEKVAMAVAVDGGRQMAQCVQPNDLAAFTSWVREPHCFWHHVMSYEVIEDSENAVEVRVTECLVARTFHAAGAGDLGSTTVCHPDHGLCRGFNPAIRLERTRTLMQGHDCCDPRWVQEA